MKKFSFVTLLVLLFSSMAFCQKFVLPEIDLKFKSPAQNFKKPFPNRHFEFRPSAPITTLDTSHKLWYKNFPNMLNGDRVIILPLDNMPCYVPKIYHLAQMPTYKGSEYAIKIPNAIDKVPF